MINGVYCHAFVVGDCKVNPGGFVVVNGTNLTGKRFVKVDPAGCSSLPMGPCMNPFSTSLRVASKRLQPKHLSPELCTDSRRTSRPRSDTLLKIMARHAGRPKLLSEDPGSGQGSCEVKAFLQIIYQGQVFVSRFTNEGVKKTESLVFQTFCYSRAKGLFEFPLLFRQLCCKDGPPPDLFCALFGNLMKGLAGQVRNVCSDFFGEGNKYSCSVGCWRRSSSCMNSSGENGLLP